MRIWIVNYYTGIPDQVSHPRYIQLARCFMNAGHEVITFCSSMLSGTQKEQSLSGKKIIERNYDDFRFVHINAPAYKGNGLKRMYSIWKFAALIRKSACHFLKPDVILHNIHPPFDYPVVQLVKELNCKYVAEAWDLWPESFVRFGLVKESNPLMKIAHVVEKRYYYTADEIVFSLKGALDYLKQQGFTIDHGGKIDPTHVHYINNGVNLEEFDKDKTLFPRSDDDINDNTLHKIIYLGSINRANDVQTLVNAFALLKEDPRYRLFVYGDGDYRKELEQYVVDNKITNVIFKEHHIAFAECAWVVSQATINVMNYHKGMGKWGSSSGKMFQYLAAGRPIICNRFIAYDNVIEDNKLGFARNLDTPEELAAAIRTIVEQPQEDYDAMCARVREVAKRYDYNVLSEEELNVVEKCFQS